MGKHKMDSDLHRIKLETGTVEVKASELEVLGPCQLGLPFEIQKSTETREEVRPWSLSCKRVFS